MTVPVLYRDTATLAAWPPNSLADLKTFYQTLFDMLAAAPSVRRLDVEGQLDLDALEAAPDSETAAQALGYAMFALDDEHQEDRPVYFAIGLGYTHGPKSTPVIYVGGDAPATGSALPNPEASRPGVGSWSNTTAAGIMTIVDDGHGFHLNVVGAGASGMVLHLSRERSKTDPWAVADDPSLAFGLLRSGTSASNLNAIVASLPYNPGGPVIAQTPSPLILPHARLVGSTSQSAQTGAWQPIPDSGIATASPTQVFSLNHGWYRDPLCVGLPPGIGSAKIDGIVYDYPWANTYYAGTGWFTAVNAAASSTSSSVVTAVWPAPAVRVEP